MVRAHGDQMAVVARAYILPGEREKLKAEMERNPRSIWILKPPCSSCGRGIRLVSSGAMGMKALPAPDKKLVA